MAINFGTDISYSASEVACVICSHNDKLTDASGKTNQAVYCRAHQHEALNEGSILAMYIYTYVRTFLSRSGMSICAHHGTHTSRALTRENTGCLAQPLTMEDRKEWRFLTMEDGQDNAIGPLQRTRFVESSTERSRRLAALRKRSQGTVEAKRARREQEKVQKKKACCGESSQARYKLCSLPCSIQPQSFLSSMAYPPACAMRTYAMARRGARHHAHAQSQYMP